MAAPYSTEPINIQDCRGSPGRTVGAPVLRTILHVDEVVFYNITTSRQKYRISIRPDILKAKNTVPYGSPVLTFKQFEHLLERRSTPSLTKDHGCGIVFRLKERVVRSAPRARIPGKSDLVINVFPLRSRIGPFVGFPVIIRLRFHLAPCKETTGILRILRTDVFGREQQTVQTKIHIVFRLDIAWNGFRDKTVSSVTGGNQNNQQRE